MAIVVEDGTQVAGANSYVSESELTTYASDRGITLSDSESVLIIKAMDYLNTLRYKGERVADDQSLPWPREGVYVDGVEIEKDEIPQRLKDAEMALALQIDSGNDPDSTLSQEVKREKADVVEVEYQDGTSSAPVLRKVNNIIEPLVVAGSIGRIVKGVIRG